MARTMGVAVGPTVAAGNGVHGVEVGRGVAVGAAGRGVGDGVSSNRTLAQARSSIASNKMSSGRFARRTRSGQPSANNDLGDRID